MLRESKVWAGFTPGNVFGKFMHAVNCFAFFEAEFPSFISWKYHILGLVVPRLETNIERGNKTNRSGTTVPRQFHQPRAIFYPPFIAELYLSSSS